MPFFRSELCVSSETSCNTHEATNFDFQRAGTIRASGGGRMGGCPCAYIYAQMLNTNKLGLVFQKDLAPGFGVFGFLKTNLTKVANSPQKLSIPLNLSLLSQLHNSPLQHA